MGQRNPERDAEILARWMAGERSVALAKAYGLHRGRMAQLIANATRPCRLVATNDIDNLGLSNRTRNGLYLSEICTHEQLLALTVREAMRIPNIGPKSVAEIVAVQERLRASR